MCTGRIYSEGGDRTSRVTRYMLPEMHRWRFDPGATSQLRPMQMADVPDTALCNRQPALPMALLPELPPSTPPIVLPAMTARRAAIVRPTQHAFQGRPLPRPARGNAPPHSAETARAPPSGPLPGAQQTPTSCHAAAHPSRCSTPGCSAAPASAAPWPPPAAAPAGSSPAPAPAGCTPARTPPAHLAHATTPSLLRGGTLRLVHASPAASSHLRVLPDCCAVRGRASTPALLTGTKGCACALPARRPAR
jgi:hypothetical protein